MASSNERDGRIEVGVSTCLLGQKVRFDGGHKHDRYITDILGEYFRFVPVCPELEVGMAVPREAVRLEGKADQPRMVGNKTGEDWTDRMNSYASERVKREDLAGLCGYILKKDSPSCGMSRVKVYNDKGMPVKHGVGLYARQLMERYPLLPVEEEGRLNDARLRDNFIARVFAYHDLRHLFAGRFKRGDVVAFHSRYKYLLMAHSQKYYQSMGKLVAAIAKYTPSEFKGIYCHEFMTALTAKATTRKNINALQHIFGYLKKHLAQGEKADILQVIADYQAELVPLVVPITLLKHYVAKFQVSYILDQVYLNPHPKELMLRNHV